MIANVALPKSRDIRMYTRSNSISCYIQYCSNGSGNSRFRLACLRFSRRNILISCVSGFIISSTFCGLSQNLEQLVIFPILQGSFGAPLVPIAMAMVLDTFPQKEHGTATAIFGMGWSLDLLWANGWWFSLRGTWLAVGIFLLVPFGIIVLFAIIAIINDRSKTDASKLD